MRNPFEAARRNWQRRHRLDYHRRQYRARVLGRAPLPERRPHLAYLFAVLPVLAIAGLLVAAPTLAAIDATLRGITGGQPTATEPTPCGQAGADPADPSCPPASVPELPPWNGKDRLNFLLVGVDRREADEIPRTDTIILVTVDPESKSVGIMSLPRDLMVTIPGGYGKDKLNAAFVYGERDQRVGGGIGLLKRTIQENLSIQITH